MQHHVVLEKQYFAPMQLQHIWHWHVCPCDARAAVDMPNVLLLVCLMICSLLAASVVEINAL